MKLPPLNRTICSRIAHCVPYRIGSLIRRLPLIAVTSLLFITTGCVSFIGIPKQHYVFSFDAADSGERPSPVPAFVIWEERIITENVEGPVASRLSKVTGYAIEDGVFECTIPANVVSCLVNPIAPMLSIDSGADYRFTVFAPGYVAVTVHPYGVYGEPPDTGDPMNKWDAPGMHNGSFASEYVTASSARVPLEWQRSQDGAISCTIMLEHLPSEDSLQQLLSRTDFIERGFPIGLFTYQVWLAANAIEKGFLGDVLPEARKTLLEAVRAQHDCYGGDRMKRRSYREEFGGKSHAEMFEECAKNPKSPCSVIQAWACP